MIFQKENLAVIAMAQITGGTGVATLSRGFGTIARTGTGVYTLDYEAGASGAAQSDAGSVLKLVTARGLTAATAITVETSTTQTTVRTFAAGGTAVDCDCGIIVASITN